jgi:hypothetical protein
VDDLKRWSCSISVQAHLQALRVVQETVVVPVPHGVKIECVECSMSIKRIRRPLKHFPSTQSHGYFPPPELLLAVGRDSIMENRK